jgi:uncharacterized membrane protein
MLERFQKVFQLLLYSHLKFCSIRQFELLTAFKEFLLIKMNKKPYFENEIRLSFTLLAAVLLSQVVG